MILRGHCSQAQEYCTRGIEDCARANECFIFCDFIAKEMKVEVSTCTCVYENSPKSVRNYLIVSIWVRIFSKHN